MPIATTLYASELRPGDYVVEAKATVSAVELIGTLVIVDFSDGTATAPMPTHAPATVIRSINLN